jgi:hypothetical protein
MNVRNPYRMVAALSLVICCASSVAAPLLPPEWRMREEKTYCSWRPLKSEGQKR